MTNGPPSQTATRIHRGDTGATVWLDADKAYKVHRSTSSFRRERDNYRALSEAGFAWAPELLAAYNQRQMLVLERIVPWEELQAAGNAPALRSIGRCLAELHALRLIELDAMPLGQALKLRVTSAVRAIGESNQNLPQRLKTLVTHHEVYETFVGCERRWCHRDFRPQNWGRARDSEMVHIMDWEHARPDLAAVDFARLHTKVSDEGYRELCAGYAMRRELPSRTQRRFAVVLRILQTLRWSLTHGEDRHLPEVEALLAHPEWWDYSRPE